MGVNRSRPRFPRLDRFGQKIAAGTNTLNPGPGWRTLTCTSCQQNVAVLEVPAGYLDDPYWGPYVCGDCKQPVVLKAAG